MLSLPFDYIRIDIDNMVDKLESIAKRDRRELLSRLKVLLKHLLKWQFQINKRSKSWENTIDEQRQQIHLLLVDSPSLKPILTEKRHDAYRLAMKAAIKETGLPKTVFPTDCPYSLEQALDKVAV
ncbi:MAG: DUF29 domain-containing protein [Gammaproteobacteria bacterium]|nr:MAG: DUF29 domain-containing protein [Gammaproteobacteria bacterium]RKZ40762.1 MAG: DUF29 domain-containing protein [Gammaproteobacteria bacterium]RKZ72547.1 MAG: DUF29 domain-containing protein [Gammaproteobacteria bacterium]